MGGPGSGNRWRSKSATCEQYMRIDLRYLRQKNRLVPNCRSSLNWSFGGEPSGSIAYVAYGNYLMLDYKVRDHGEEEWQEVKQNVHFDWTELNFGGKRQWFLCPRCNRRCLILYGGARFYCRKCYRLGYNTQSETPWQRQITRAQKIRERLGSDGGIDDMFPEKPKGMHWKTYRRLERIDEHAQDMWAAMITQFISKF